MLGAVTYTLYMGFSETDDKIESKVVCGELTLKQRRADGISLGSENASGNYTDLCDKLTIRTRHLAICKTQSIGPANLKRVFRTPGFGATGCRRLGK